MTTGELVEAIDVVGDRGSGDLAAEEVFVVDVLGLERHEEALGDGVVVAVAGPPPRPRYTAEQLAEVPS